MELRKTTSLLILVCWPILIAAQSSEEAIRAIESKLLDVPAAAHRLTASPNGRGYEFRNNSDLRVAQMQLGCTQKKKDGIKILTVRPIEDIDLAPADFRFWQSNHGLFPGEACKKGKLAIVEIKFANGTQWKLKS